MRSSYLFLGVGAAGLVGAAVYFLTGKKAEPEVESTAPSDTNYFSQPAQFPSLDFLISNPLDVVSEWTGVGDLLSGQTRGIRNNNPLNIKWNSLNNWQGQTGQDSEGFAIFDKPENGIRAGARILQNYAKAGYVNVDQIIKNWTRGDSADIQAAYVRNVSNALGISANQKVVSSQYPTMIAAMIKQENGRQPYAMSTIIAGVNAA